MVSVHLVRQRLASTTAVSPRMTVRRGGGGASAKQEASLVVVAPKTALQAAGEREEGESLESTRRKARQEESRKRGTFSSGTFLQFDLLVSHSQRGFWVLERGPGTLFLVQKYQPI